MSEQPSQGSGSEQPDSQPSSDDAVERRSGAVSEDVQLVTTDEDAETTARGSVEGAEEPERTDTGNDPQTG
jgi:hypothetical protein